MVVDSPPGNDEAVEVLQFFALAHFDGMAPASASASA